MKRTKKSGFSLLEVIAAVVILAVVAAATVATVAPMRAKSEDKLAEQDIASLNAMAQTYYLEKGAYPRNIAYLVRENYIKADDTASRTRYNKLRQYPYDAATGTFSKPVTNQSPVFYRTTCRHTSTNRSNPFGEERFLVCACGFCLPIDVSDVLVLMSS